MFTYLRKLTKIAVTVIIIFSQQIFITKLKYTDFSLNMSHDHCFRNINKKTEVFMTKIYFQIFEEDNESAKFRHDNDTIRITEMSRNE